jgi:hypothetical protein
MVGSIRADHSKVEPFNGFNGFNRFNRFNRWNRFSVQGSSVLGPGKVMAAT